MATLRCTCFLIIFVVPPIQIQFDHRQSIAGANIHTFLLERSRVVFQPLSERNYHIFYRLCAGVPSAERAEFALDDYSTFHYLNQGGQGKIEDVDDAEMFAATVRAFSTIGLSVNVQWQIFQLLAAILHLGNIVVKTNRPEQCTIDADCIALDHASRLLGVPTNSMRKWLTFKKINAAGEVVISPLDLNTAIATRDAIAKYIYHMLFEWLVQTINATLKARNEEDVSNFIAVLGSSQ